MRNDEKGCTDSTRCLPDITFIVAKQATECIGESVGNVWAEQELDLPTHKSLFCICKNRVHYNYTRLVT